MNLFEIASGNADTLDKRAADLREARYDDQEALDLMDRFVDRIGSDGRIAVNMRPWVLSRFLCRGDYKNIYGWAEEMADLSGRDPEDLRAAELGSFKERRQVFDATFSDSEHFRYGALNIGGAGADHYGEFCFVARKAFAADAHCSAYVRGDSLRHYVDTTGVLLESKIRSDVAPASHRHILALLKHASDLKSSTDWAGLVCSSTDYIEVIFVAELKPEDGEEVRIGTAAYQALWDLTFDSFTQSLSAGEKALQMDLVDILSGLQERSLALVEV